MNNSFKWAVVGSSACVVVLLLVGARSGRAVAPDDVYGHLKVYTEVLERWGLQDEAIDKSETNPPGLPKTS